MCYVCCCGADHFLKPLSLVVVDLLGNEFPPLHLLPVRVPKSRLVPSPFGRTMCSHVLVVQGIDINANMLPHQTNTQSVGKPANFEWLASHLSKVIS